MNIRDRALEERSYLRFQFNQNEEEFVSILMPFFENVLINESRSANFSKLNPIGRNYPLYTFTSADSRKLFLRFNITLFNLYEYFKDNNIFKIIVGPLEGEDKEQIKRRFLDPLAFPSGDSRISTNDKDFKTTQIQRAIRAFRQFVPEAAIEAAGLSDFSNFLIDGLDSINIFSEFLTERDQDPENTRTKIRTIYLFWLNLIRVSNLTNAKNPSWGPPIIRVNHGANYQDIPCICTNYTINADPNAGMDLETLLPHRAMVTMELSEVRKGSFGTYRPGDVVNGDSVPGWDSLLDHGSIDPMIDQEILEVILES